MAWLVDSLIKKRILINTIICLTPLYIYITPVSIFSKIIWFLCEMTSLHTFSQVTDESHIAPPIGVKRHTAMPFCPHNIMLLELHIEDNKN